ncbi:MAG: tetratricopeptide repeat protein, partial [Geminicoccaceae bacterium]
MATALLMLGLVSGARADSLGDVRTGNAAFGDGRYEAAVDAFSRAILAGDLNHEALAITFNNRGVAYSELGDYDRAVSDYGQALALVPGDATAIRNLRIAYIRRAAASARLGDRDAAVADYDRAIELEPNHPLAYLRRGQLALERGDRAAAVADLTRARDLDPQNTDVAALLAAAERMPAEAAAPEPPATDLSSAEPAPTTIEPPLQAVEPAAEPPAQVAAPAEPQIGRA